MDVFFFILKITTQGKNCMACRCFTSGMSAESSENSASAVLVWEKNKFKSDMKWYYFR